MGLSVVRCGAPAAPAGERAQPLVGEGSSGPGTTGPVHHKHFTHVLQLLKPRLPRSPGSAAGGASAIRSPRTTPGEEPLLPAAGERPPRAAEIQCSQK